LVCLWAAPETGRSLLALEIAAGLATGQAVLGNPPREPVTMVYLDSENRLISLVERLQAMGYHHSNLKRLRLQLPGADA
jgi:RecA-family ATPase